jgi:gluconolactonase
MAGFVKLRFRLICFYFQNPFAECTLFPVCWKGLNLFRAKVLLLFSRTLKNLLTVLSGDEDKSPGREFRSTLCVFEHHRLLPGGNESGRHFAEEASSMRRSLLITVSVLTFLVICHSGTAQVARRTFALEAQDPTFWNLVSRDTKLETIASGFRFTEGPMWDPSGFLYVSDEKGNKIYRVYPSGRKEEVIAIGDPDGNTLDRQQRLIDCSSVLRAVVEITPAGKYNILANSYEGKKLNTPNDVTVGPGDALYFTDPNMDLAKGEKQELPFQGVYRLDKKGELTLLAKDLSEPNGLAFSPDGKHFYVDDSEQKNIRVYDVTSNGLLANGRIFGAEPGEDDEGVPDGIKVDRDGNLYVTGSTSVYRLRTKTAGYVPYSK